MTLKTVLALGLFAVTLGAHAEEAVGMPELRTGDKWTVVGTDLMKNKVSWKVQREVIKVDGNIATWKYERLPPSTPATGESRLDTAAQVLIDSNLVSGKREVTNFPLVPGKEWKYEYEWKGSYGIVRYEVKAKVVGWEDITVPAGTFHCLRIEHNSYWSRESNIATDGTQTGTIRGRNDTVYWYGPTAKAMVKTATTEYRPTGGVWRRYGEELVEVSVNRN